MKKENALGAIVAIVNICVVLNTIFRRMVLGDEVQYYAAVGVPIIVSIALLCVLKFKNLDQSLRNLILISYGFVGIAAFRWLLVMLL